MARLARVNAPWSLLAGGLLVVCGVLVVASAPASAADAQPVFAQSLAARFVNPAYGFVSIIAGALLVLFELVTPTGFITGTIGGVLIIGGLLFLSLLPVTIVGMALLLLGVGLCITEPFVPGIGWLGAIGGLAVAGSTIVLFSEPGVSISPAVLIPTVMVLVAASIGTSVAARIDRHEPSVMGRESLVGTVGTVRTADGRRGQVFVAGEVWGAVSTGEDLVPGEEIRVVAVQGLSLTVERARE